MTALKLGVSLVQPQVATVLMIVADVSSHEPDEMTCAENHHVLKELATAAAVNAGLEFVCAYSGATRSLIPT